MLKANNCLIIKTSNIRILVDWNIWNNKNQYFFFINNIIINGNISKKISIYYYDTTYYIYNFCQFSQNKYYDNWRKCHLFSNWKYIGIEVQTVQVIFYICKIRLNECLRQNLQIFWLSRQKKSKSVLFIFV